MSNPTPYTAVDSAVRAHIENQGSTVEPDSDVHGCGCQYLPRLRAYRLCRYHDGMNDGLAMAEGAEDRPAIPKFPGLHDRPDTGKECHYLAVTMPHGGLFCNKCGWAGPAEGAEDRGQTHTQNKEKP